jgi:hypothetical protein
MTQLSVRTTVLLCLVAASGVPGVFAHGPSAALGRQHQNACYPAQFTPFRTRNVQISDSVAKLNAVVRRPLDVCAPAAIDRARSADANLYLTCYEISAHAISPRSVGKVSNLFGTAPVTVASPRALCMSSSRTTKPPAPVRLTCYSVTSPSGAKRTNRTIGDTFGASLDSVLVGRPVTFCAESRQAPGTPLHLICYAVSSETTGRTVVVTDAWGVLRGSLGRRDRLCLESSLKG